MSDEYFECLLCGEKSSDPDFIKVCPHCENESCENCPCDCDCDELEDNCE